MNKKIILLAVALMLFAGVVSASSINGDYKGNPIVMVTSNGKLLETDEVPAHIIDGHTLVPISLLRQLGASVTWDTYSYVVDVKLPITSGDNQQPSSGSLDNDIRTIKLYSRIAEQYKRLGALGDIISSLSSNFSATYDTISNNYSRGTQIQDAKSYLTTAIDSYNYGRNEMIEVQKLAESANLDISDANQILQDYHDALANYEKSYNSLEGYSRSKRNADTQNYLDYSGKGFDTSKTPRTQSLVKYFEWYDKVQNY